MIVNDFRETCSQYQNFEVWDVESIDAFFRSNSVLGEIFIAEYKIPLGEFHKRRSEITDTNMEIMKKLLDQVGDKHFFIFTYHDDNHSVLVQMQNQKIMNFGLDIEDIRKDHVFILVMDKTTEAKSLEI